MVDSVRHKMLISEALAAMKGRVIGGEVFANRGDYTFSGVSTDSRTIKSGDLFFALMGDTFDGHDYLADVVTRGAGGAVVEERILLEKGTEIPGGVPVIAVGDTLFALGELARSVRSRFPGSVVGITGSNGKTTTKELVARVVETRYKTKKTEGNFNNLIGLPMTVLNLEGDDEALILEMGMNTLGEIERLCEIGAPTIGLVTNIGPVHLEGVGSIEGVAREKGALVRAIPRGGFSILNADCARSMSLRDDVASEVLTFGMENPADVRAHDITDLGDKGVNAIYTLPSGDVSVHLKLPGLHNVMNALAAACVGVALGIEPDRIREALEGARSPKMRMEIYTSPNGPAIINDSYNANPVSVAAALRFLRDYARREKRRSVAVLGEMLELGDFSGEGHESVGRKAAEAGCGELFFLGNHGDHFLRGAISGGLSNGKVHLYARGEHERLISDLRGHLDPGDVVLIKGSRGMRMEQVISGIVGSLKE